MVAPNGTSTGIDARVTPVTHGFRAVDDPEQHQDELTNFPKNSTPFGAALVLATLGGTAWPYAINIGLRGNHSDRLLSAIIPLSVGRKGCSLLVEVGGNAVEELLDPAAFEFPPRRRVMVLHEDRLDRVELGDGEAGLAGLERLERPEHLGGRGFDTRGRALDSFPFDPIEEHVVERPLEFTRHGQRDRARSV